MTYAFQNPSQDTIFDFLKEAKTIAVVGLSIGKKQPYRVSRIMQDAGYRIIPVNPRSAGETILGETVYASLKDIPLSIDIVNVFRRVNFSQTLLVNSLKQMLRFSGLNSVWKVKEAEKSFVGQVETRLS